jgi:hypothetical protein
MVKWRGPDKLTFSNRAERAAYIEAHPVPDEWENPTRLRYETEHPFLGDHKKISREHEGRPLRWCVTCHVPGFLGWYCGASCDKKKEPCRAMVYEEGQFCRLHYPEKVAERKAQQHQKERERREKAYNKRRLKEGKPPLQRPYFTRQHTTDVQHVTSTSQVRQTEGEGEAKPKQRQTYRDGLEEALQLQGSRVRQTSTSDKSSPLGVEMT